MSIEDYLRHLKQEFDLLWDQYVCEDNANLTGAAIELKQSILNFVVEAIGAEHDWPEEDKS